MNIFQLLMKWVEERGSASALRERLALEQERRALSDEMHAREIADLKKKEVAVPNVSVEPDGPDSKPTTTGLQQAVDTAIGVDHLGRSKIPRIPNDKRRL